jgi:hypothetical protein
MNNKSVKMCKNLNPITIFSQILVLVFFSGITASAQGVRFKMLETQNDWLDAKNDAK